MQLQRTLQASIHRGDGAGYIAECSYLHTVTQGSTLDEVVSNLREAVALALEGEDLAELGLAPSPVLLVTFELEPAVA